MKKRNMTGNKHNRDGDLTFRSFLSGAGVRFLRLLQVYAAQFWQTQESALTAMLWLSCCDSSETETTDAAWTHQVPFSRVFIPMHIILYHLLHGKHPTNSKLLFFFPRFYLFIIGSISSKSADSRSYLVFLGDEAVYNQRLQLQLSA